MQSPGAQDNVSVSQGVRMMFYLMKPSETAFPTVEEVPDYVKKVRLSAKGFSCSLLPTSTQHILGIGSISYFELLQPHKNPVSYSHEAKVQFSREFNFYTISLSLFVNPLIYPSRI